MSNGRGYVCDACFPGYSGQYCESCLPGYYGNPTSTNGSCLKCACHKFGSENDICHNVTGQCLCKHNINGRDCSLCSPRHAFLNGVCTCDFLFFDNIYLYYFILACDRSCHKELMKLEDEIEYSLASVPNLGDLKPIPHKRLLRISNNISCKIIFLIILFKFKKTIDLF